MLGYVIIGMLAAFGLVCAIWIVCGAGLPHSRGYLLYVGDDVCLFSRRYLWLREMGLLRCPLYVTEPDDTASRWLSDRGIEICSREDLCLRFGIGEKEFDGTGTGDPAGRHQRCGISEL